MAAALELKGVVKMTDKTLAEEWQAGIERMSRALVQSSQELVARLQEFRVTLVKGEAVPETVTTDSGTWPVVDAAECTRGSADPVEETGTRGSDDDACEADLYAVKPQVEDADGQEWYAWCPRCEEPVRLHALVCATCGAIAERRVLDEESASGGIPGSETKMPGESTRGTDSGVKPYRRVKLQPEDMIAPDGRQPHPCVLVVVDMQVGYTAARDKGLIARIEAAVDAHHGPVVHICSDDGGEACVDLGPDVHVILKDGDSGGREVYAWMRGAGLVTADLRVCVCGVNLLACVLGTAIGINLLLKNEKDGKGKGVCGSVYIIRDLCGDENDRVQVVNTMHDGEPLGEVLMRYKLQRADGNDVGTWEYVAADPDEPVTTAPKPGRPGGTEEVGTADDG